MALGIEVRELGQIDVHTCRTTAKLAFRVYGVLNDQEQKRIMSLLLVLATIVPSRSAQFSARGRGKPQRLVQ